ncbi:nitrate/nitrite sensor protein NarQ [Pseudonocardia autotrophica]|nr:nitrate/nitrite sensor protein NarQ [Pseudonocardia autotrophica]
MTGPPAGSNRAWTAADPVDDPTRDAAARLLEARDTEEALGLIAELACGAVGGLRALVLLVDPAEASVEVRGVHRVLTGRGVGARRLLLAEHPVVNSLLERTAGLDLDGAGALADIPEIAGLLGTDAALRAEPLRHSRTGTLALVLIAVSGAPTAPESAVLRRTVALGALAAGTLLRYERSALAHTSTARRRISADLHDGVAQLLFAAALDVEELRSELGAAAPPPVTATLTDLGDRLNEATGQLRHAVRRLAEGWQAGARYGGPLTDSSIYRTVASAVERARSDGIVADLTVHGSGPEPGPEGAALLLRTVREGMANVQKHAAANVVSVVLRCSASWWTVEVADDGDGDSRAIRRTLRSALALSFGLASLQADATQLGGRLWVDQDLRLGGVVVGIAVPTTTAAH